MHFRPSVAEEWIRAFAGIGEGERLSAASPAAILAE
jgi:hypothetical protein